MSNRTFLARIAVTVSALVIAQAGALLLLWLLGAADAPYAVLASGAALLVACVALIVGYGLTAEDVGLKLLPDLVPRHVVLALLILSLYLLYYVFGVRISALRTITEATWWTLLGYLVVVIAEELYFRGVLYHLFNARFSNRAAVVGTAVLFALAHVREGPAALLRFPTGLLWGSVRHSTRMIFLLVFPVHFAYNAVWLLFQGNWDDPPSWYLALPLLELILGAAITILSGPGPRKAAGMTGAAPDSTESAAPERPTALDR